MIERLLQNIKRRLSVLNNYPKWTKITLADKIGEIIQEKKIIPNSTTKTSPCTAHFGRKHNRPISNITTQTSTKKPIVKRYNEFLFRQEERTEATDAKRGNNLESRILLKTRTRHLISGSIR